MLVMVAMDRRPGRNPFDGILAFGIVIGALAVVAIGLLVMLVAWLARHLDWVA